MQEREPESMAAFEAAYPVNARIEYGENLCYHWWGTAYFGLNTGDRALSRGSRAVPGDGRRARRTEQLGSATAGLALDDADHGLAEAALEEAREAMAHLVSAGAGLALPS